MLNIEGGREERRDKMVFTRRMCSFEGCGKEGRRRNARWRYISDASMNTLERIGMAVSVDKRMEYSVFIRVEEMAYFW